MPTEKRDLPTTNGNQQRHPSRMLGGEELDYTRKGNASLATTPLNGTMRTASTIQTRPAAKKPAKPPLSPRFPKAARAVSAGLVIVGIKNPETAEEVRDAFEVEVMIAGKQTGLAMPKVEYVVSLRSGGPHASADAEASAAFEDIPESAAERRCEFHGWRTTYDFFRNEALDPLLQAIEDAAGNCVTVAITVSSPSDRYFIDTLGRIRAAAASAGTCVIVLVDFEKSDEASELDDFCEQYLEVETCEPGPGAQEAFSIAVSSRKRLQKRGIGKVMCSVDYVNDRCVRRYEPFIAASIKDRFIWELAAHGLTCEETGEILKCDKSTVSRHRKEMRKQLGKVRPRTISDERYAEYLELCDVESATEELEGMEELDDADDFYDE